MSNNTTASPPAPPRKAHWAIKLLVSLIVLFHLSAILSHVIAGGGPFVMRQLSSLYRPYLKTMWLDNAYRFYAPDPGPTEVFWYKLHYQDGTTRWTQVPRREDFYLRMPFQRHMSIALLGSMMVEQEPVPPTDNAASVASVLVNNQTAMRTVLTPMGQIFLRSYARHIASVEKEHPASHSPLAYMDCYLVKYLIRSPLEMRFNLDMYDPRMLRIQYVAAFTPDGLIANHKDGFKEKAPDDLFIELLQDEILPLVEANNKLTPDQRKPIMQILRDYGIPFPLIQPIAKLPEANRELFFQKPFDKDSLRERYATLVRRDDRTMQKLVDLVLAHAPGFPMKLNWSLLKDSDLRESPVKSTNVSPAKSPAN